MFFEVLDDGWKFNEPRLKNDVLSWVDGLFDEPGCLFSWMNSVFPAVLEWVDFCKYLKKYTYKSDKQEKGKQKSLLE